MKFRLSIVEMASFYLKKAFSVSKLDNDLFLSRKIHQLSRNFYRNPTKFERMNVEDDDDEEETRRFYAAQRWEEMETDNHDWEVTHPYTCFVFRLKNIDPDAAYSFGRKFFFIYRRKEKKF